MIALQSIMEKKMSDISNRTITPEDLSKIKQVIKEGVTVQREIDDLRESLRDTVKHVAEQLDIKPKILNAAIRAKYKENLEEAKEALSDVEEIIGLVE